MMLAIFTTGFNLPEFVQMLADHWISEFRDLGDWPIGTFESIAEYIDIFPIVVCLVWSILRLDLRHQFVSASHDSESAAGI